jgi:TctA family transporter
MEYAPIGLILAPLAEGQLRSGLIASGGSLLPLVQRPIPLSFLVVSVAMAAWPAYRGHRRRRAAGGD